jgi:hypothetical protein
VPYGIEEVDEIMMGLLASNTGSWKEGITQLEWPCVENLHSEGGIMINNSSITKWHRLAHKQLDQEFPYGTDTDDGAGLGNSPLKSDRNSAPLIRPTL